MAQERPSRIVQWVVILRTQAPELRRKLGEYASAVREQPSMLWEAPALRYSVYALGLLIGAYALSLLARSMVPGAQDARPPATSADFHVVCVEPDCGNHFVIVRPFGFHKFPVECPLCHKLSGMSAVRCTSDQCKGRWVAPVMRNDKRYCPYCSREFPPL